MSIATLIGSMLETRARGAFGCTLWRLSALSKVVSTFLVVSFILVSFDVGFTDSFGRQVSGGHLSGFSCSPLPFTTLSRLHSWTTWKEDGNLVLESYQDVGVPERCSGVDSQSLCRVLSWFHITQRNEGLECFFFSLSAFPIQQRSSFSEFSSPSECPNRRYGVRGCSRGWVKIRQRNGDHNGQ